jgi:hypothetical protein
VASTTNPQTYTHQTVNDLGRIVDVDVIIHPQNIHNHGERGKRSASPWDVARAHRTLGGVTETQRIWMKRLFLFGKKKEASSF